MPSSHVKDSVKLFKGRDLDLYNIIFETVTKNREAVQETARTCKQLFKKGANSYVLTRLEELFKARQDEQTIKKHLESSEQGASSGALAKLEESVKRKREDYEYYTQHFLPVLKEEIMKSEKLAKLPVFNKETEQSQGPETRKGEIVGIILDITSRSKDKSHPSKKTEESGNKEPTEETTVNLSTANLSNGSGSDSGMSLDEQSTTSTSSQGSLDSTLSSAEEDDTPQIEETKSQVQPEQTVKKEPGVSFQRVTLESREKEPWIPVSSTGMTDGHRNPLQSEEKNRENTTVQEPSVNKNNRSSNKQLSPVENMSVNEFFAILEEIKKGDKNYSDKKAADIGAPGKCKRAFKKGVDLEELLTELEKSVKGNTEHRNNFTKHFLPVLLKKILFSVELEGIEGIAKIIWDFIKQGLKEEEHKRYAERLLQRLEAEIQETNRLVGRKEREVRITIAKKILGNISKNSNKIYSSEETAEQSTNVVEGSGDKELTVTSELSDGSGLDSGVGSDKRSTTSTSSEESLDSTPSSVEGNSSLRKEETEDQMQSEQTAKKEPEVSFQHVTLKSRKKESWIPVSSTGMTDGQWQSEEKKDKENASVKKPSANENNGEGMPPEKQSNNRGLYKGFATGCAGLAVGCLIAGVITLGAGLFVMAAVFAIAAIATRYLTPPSSELTSTTLSPLVDAKQR